MRFAKRKSDGQRIKAARDTPSLPKGEYLCENPWCENPEVFVKGNVDAKGRRTRRESTVHVIPHFSHYVAEENAYPYRDDDDVNSHIVASMLIQEMLGIDDDHVDVWIKGEEPKDTVCPDLIWEHDGRKYAVEIQHSLMPTDEYERRQIAYEKHGMIPVWILHEEEHQNGSSYEDFEAFRKEFGVGKYAKRDEYSYTTTYSFTSKFERRVARRQGYVIYYRFLAPYNIADPKIALWVGKFERDPERKTKYRMLEYYPLDHMDKIEYVFRQIAYRSEKYKELRNSQEFDGNNKHYAYDEATERWYVHSINVKCQKCGKDAFFPPNVDASGYKCQNCMEEEWIAKYGGKSKTPWREKYAYKILDMKRQTD